jgi:hypothetical protein
MTASIRDVADGCLDKTGRLSVREDILGVYAADNPQDRSVLAQLDRIQNASFVKVALVTVSGAAPTLQRDLDNGNTVWFGECGVWIYPTASITVVAANLLTLDQDDCLSAGHSVSAEEDQLFDFGRNLGADIVGYYINGDAAGFRGCAAHPPGRRGFWVGSTASPWTWVHELTHVVGDNPHFSNTDNLMISNTGTITNPPPNLTSGQCSNINGDPAIESC